MRHQFKSTYNPDQASLDKVRQSVTVEAENMVTAIPLALAELGLFKHTVEVALVVDDFKESRIVSDGADCWEWITIGNDGTYTFEIVSLKDEEVTEATILAWAIEQGKKAEQFPLGQAALGKACSENEQIREILLGIVGRSNWRDLENASKRDLMEEAQEKMEEEHARMDQEELLEAVLVITSHSDQGDGPVSMAKIAELDPKLYSWE
jgi:hypothetical protein